MLTQNLYFVSLSFRFDQKFGCIFCMFIVLSLGASVQQKKLMYTHVEVGQNHSCGFFVCLGIRVVRFSKVLKEVCISRESNISKWNELFSIFLCLQKPLPFLKASKQPKGPSDQTT